MNKQKALISDIDGTISDRRHRLHYIEGKKDWDRFFEALVDDPVIQDTIDQIKSLLSADKKLIFFTGRPEKYRLLTQKWIRKNTPFKDYILLMRKNKDYRKDAIIKKEILDLIREDYEVGIIFEDQPELSKIWQAENIKCILVNE